MRLTSAVGSNAFQEGKIITTRDNSTFTPRLHPYLNFEIFQAPSGLHQAGYRIFSFIFPPLWLIGFHQANHLSSLNQLSQWL